MRLLVIPVWPPQKEKRYLLSDQEFAALMKHFTKRELDGIGVTII